ncbi:MAG: hypothetical protein L6R39_007519 [Caloplaca ligustica]|nr:MAG: hypothetical protein L6R39_007519 [Caloplaca ligustica]
MAQINQSLLDYLRHANPQLERSHCRKGGNTSSPSYAAEPDAFERWDDFELSTFEAVDNGALKTRWTRQYQLPRHDVPAQLPFCDIHDEASLQPVLNIWMMQRVSAALHATQRDDLGSPPRGTIYMAIGGQVSLPKGKTCVREQKPDWGGVLRPHDTRKKPKTILPGETKVSSKWSSDKIPIGHKQELPLEIAKPISQLFRYCLLANARYGCLLTDKELVAVRIDIESPEAFKERAVPKDVKAHSRKFTFRFKSISWDNAASEDSSTMTINLALFLLLIIAASNDGEITDDQEALDQALQHFGRKRTAPAVVELRDAGTSMEEDETLGEGHSKSFLSGTSTIRRGLSGASLGNHGRDTASPAPSRSGKKHVLGPTSDKGSASKRMKSSKGSKKHPMATQD